MIILSYTLVDGPCESVRPPVRKKRDRCAVPAEGGSLCLATRERLSSHQFSLCSFVGPAMGCRHSDFTLDCAAAMDRHNKSAPSATLESGFFLRNRLFPSTAADLEMAKSSVDPPRGGDSADVHLNFVDSSRREPNRNRVFRVRFPRVAGALSRLACFNDRFFGRDG